MSYVLMITIMLRSVSITSLSWFLSSVRNVFYYVYFHHDNKCFIKDTNVNYYVLSIWNLYYPCAYSWDNEHGTGLIYFWLFSLSSYETSSLGSKRGFEKCYVAVLSGSSQNIFLKVCLLVITDRIRKQQLLASSFIDLKLNNSGISDCLFRYPSDNVL